MALPTQPYKGARDFYPEDKRVQKYMFRVLRKTVESFGYQEYDAPIIEPIELYISKTSDEIVAEQTYNFLDRGGRHVTLRPEMTPTVSRMVAGRRQELSYPLRLYSTPNLWRYERPQHGRLREHWQLNVDLFGVVGIEGDHEIVLLADSIMQAFGAKRTSYEIRINSRIFINWAINDYLAFDRAQGPALIRLIDKMAKISEKQFLATIDALMTDGQRRSDRKRKLLELMKVKKISELPAEARQHPAVAELEKLISILSEGGVSNIVFDTTLMRGFDYYTNVIFEVFDRHPHNNRSMFGGGRYDGLVGAFGVEPLPTVGFGMGDVTLLNFLEAHKLLPILRTETDATVILIGDIYEGAQKVLQAFRREGVRLALDPTDRKIDAKIRSAFKAGIPHALFIGEQELATQRFKLKNLTSGQEHEHSFERIVSLLASRHAAEEDL